MASETEGANGSEPERTSELIEALLGQVGQRPFRAALDQMPSHRSPGEQGRHRAQLVRSRQPGRPGAAPVHRVCHVRRALTLVSGPCHNLPAKGRVIPGFPRNAPLGWQVLPGLSMVTRAGEQCLSGRGGG